MWAEAAQEENSPQISQIPADFYIRVLIFLSFRSNFLPNHACFFQLICGDKNEYWQWNPRRKIKPVSELPRQAATDGSLRGNKCRENSEAEGERNSRPDRMSECSARSCRTQKSASELSSGSCKFRLTGLSIRSCRRQSTRSICKKACGSMSTSRIQAGFLTLTARATTRNQSESESATTSRCWTQTACSGESLTQALRKASPCFWALKSVRQESSGLHFQQELRGRRFGWARRREPQRHLQLRRLGQGKRFWFTRIPFVRERDR